MAKERNALRAGIFMLVSIALVIFVIIAISGVARFTERFNTYVVAFSLQDDIGGLRVGDDARIGGLKVGMVKNIILRDVKPPDGKRETPAILVFVALPERYKIAANANVVVQKGITGAATINIDDLGQGPALASSGYLIGRPDPLSEFTHELGKMAPDLHETLNNLKITSANIRQASPKIGEDLDKFARTADSFTQTGHEASATVTDLRGRVPDIIERYHDVTAAAVKMLNAVDDLLGPSTTDFHTTVANLRAATNTLNERLPGLLDQVHGILQHANETMLHANSAVSDVQAAVNNTKELTGAARDILVDNKSKFGTMISSFQATSENLKYASSEIRHSPWRLLYQPKPGEVANMNIYDSMRQFAEGADKLDNAASALRDAVKDKDTDPAQIRKLMQQLDESFSHFQEVQKQLWKDVKD